MYDDDSIYVCMHGCRCVYVRDNDYRATEVRSLLLLRGEKMIKGKQNPQRTNYLSFQSARIWVWVCKGILQIQILSFSPTPIRSRPFSEIAQASIFGWVFDDDDGFGRYIAVADVAGVVVDADAVVEVSSESVQFARPRNIFVLSKKKPYASGSSSWGVSGQISTVQYGSLGFLGSGVGSSLLSEGEGFWSVLLIFWTSCGDRKEKKKKKGVQRWLMITFLGDMIDNKNREWTYSSPVPNEGSTSVVSVPLTLPTGVSFCNSFSLSVVSRWYGSPLSSTISASLKGVDSSVFAPKGNGGGFKGLKCRRLERKIHPTELKARSGVCEGELKTCICETKSRGVGRVYLENILKEAKIKKIQYLNGSILDDNLGRNTYCSRDNPKFYPSSYHYPKALK